MVRVGIAKDKGQECGGKRTKGQMVMKREDLKTNMVRVGIEKVQMEIISRVMMYEGEDQDGYR